FWHVLNAYSEMELAIGQKEWLFKEVLGEIQLLLEQAEATNVDGNAAEVILYQDKLPDFSVVGDWVCCGMNEKYYPSRTRLREGLRSQSDLSLLWENEQNEFAGLCGLAFSRVVFTSSKINFKGDELNPSGLLDTIEKDIWKADEWQIKQAPGKLLSKEASRFFTRGVTVFNNRKNRDSRYLGLVCSDSAKNRLVEYFNSNYGFSSTSLESAALCPFQFFAEQVLKIEKNEVNDDIGTNYLVEGNVIHAILEDIHKCLPLIDTLALNEISKLLGEKLDEYFQPSERVKESNFALARWRIQRRRIEQKLSGYAEQLAKQLVADQKKNDQPVRVIGVELNTRAGNIRIDPLVFLDEKTGLETRIHGRIDRVDQLSDGEQAKIRIIDYKSGNRINAAEIEG
ncbi:MAG: PD-(D/E)XK nuclease family protein, partial [bacterium]